MTPRDWLSIYTITHGTQDYGTLYVVREWRTYTPERKAPVPGFVYSPETRNHMAIEPCAVAPTLHQVRQWLEPLGLYRLPRDPDDEPAVVESWI